MQLKDIRYSIGKFYRHLRSSTKDGKNNKKNEKILEITAEILNR